MVRRSRCIYVAILTALIYVIIFCVLSKDGPSATLFSGKFLQFKLDFSEFNHIFEVKDSYSLDKWADAIYRKKLIDNKDDVAGRMAKLTIDGPDEHRNTIELPAFLSGKYENPHLVPHDPRLTLGILFSDFNKRLEKGQSPETLKLDYFHWGDWTDLSALDRKMLSVRESQMSCKTLNSQGLTAQKDVPDAYSYCYDDENIATMLAGHKVDPYMRPYFQKIAESPYIAGMHVYKCPKRASGRVRTLAAASYLHDFMPPPMAVNFIFQKPAQNPVSFHIPVNQHVSGRERLIDTRMAVDVAQKNEKLDIRFELSQLTSRINPDMSKSLSYEKTLSHSQFVDNSSEIANELSQKQDLSPQDQLYLDSLRYSLSTENPTKYFYEALLVRSERNWATGGHHDWRFFKSLKVSQDQHLPLLHGLISAWLRFTNANEITTWIAHGSLLGWYWNGLSFPWDSDYDVQVPVSDLHKLARKFNQTVIVDVGSDLSPEVRLGRYFLDCGTWTSHREAGNGLNNIDARFIDMDSGLYIDITALAVSANMSPKRYDEYFPENLQKPAVQRQTDPDPRFELERNNAGRLYNCRNRHVSSLVELSPLRLTSMEGVLAYVPNRFTDTLQAEYGKNGIDSQKFRSFAFLPRLRLWANAKVIARYTREKQAQNLKVELGADEKYASSAVDKLSIFTFSDQDYLELMAAEKDLLFEYLVTKDATAFHQQEMEMLLSGLSTEGLYNESASGLAAKHLRPDFNNYIAVKEGQDFSSKVKEYLEKYEEFKKGKETSGPQEETGNIGLPPNRRFPLLVQDADGAYDEVRTRPDQSMKILEA